jgi:DNA mismatch endonuclease (patch repair protein)
MSRQATRDTAPEWAIRQRLHASGLRYRVNHPPVPGLRRRADIVFARSKVAVFVDGCFWHSCPEHGTSPKSNAGWWADKLEANRRRDAETDRVLTAAGWTVVRVWEHEDPDMAADHVGRAVQSQLGQQSKDTKGPSRL